MSKEEKLTLTLRLVKSFPHDNVKNLVLGDVDPSMTIKELKQVALQS